MSLTRPARAARFLLVAFVAFTFVGFTSACGDDFAYEGSAGAPTSANFDLWVPVVDLAVVADTGEVSGAVIVDTGAPFTVLDRDVYGLSDGKGNANLRGMGLTFPDYPIISYDVFDQDSGGFAGLLGGDLLRHFALSLDYKGERLWLRDTDVGVLPDGVVASTVRESVSVPFELRGGGQGLVPGECPGGCGNVSVAATRVLVQVRLEDMAAPQWFLLDTGASSTVLAEELLEELGDPLRPYLRGVSVATVTGLQNAYLTRVSTMSIVHDGGEVAVQSSQPVLVVPGWSLFSWIYDETGVRVRGLLGGSYLRHFLTTIDYTGNQLRLARYVSQSHVSANEFVRVGFVMSKLAGQWQVGDVYSGSDAETQGLSRGDVVAEVNGTGLDGLDEAAVSELFTGFALGQRVPVGIQAANGVQTIDVMVEDLLPAYE